MMYSSNKKRNMKMYFREPERHEIIPPEKAGLLRLLYP